MAVQARYPDFVVDQREYFDSLVSEDWATYQNPVWDDQRRREVEAVLSHVEARRVLDVGCGCGFHDVELAEWPGIEEVVGIDYSPKSIEVAEREYGHPRVRRFVADVFELEADEQPFDLVVSFQVIEHLASPFGFLDACLRFVRRGGILAVVTPNRGRLDNRLRELLGKKPLLLDPQHFQEYTPRELRELAAPLPLVPLATLGLGAQLTIPRSRKQVLPAPLGWTLAGRSPALSSSFAQLWKRR